HRPKLEASHSAVRALSVSTYNRGCMWHVSAPHRPCIGHRTGYSLHENARISGLASADFEGVFAHSYKRGAPGFFYARCARLCGGDPKANAQYYYGPYRRHVRRVYRRAYRRAYYGWISILLWRIPTILLWRIL